MGPDDANAVARPNPFDARSLKPASLIRSVQNSVWRVQLQDIPELGEVMVAKEGLVVQRSYHLDLIDITV